MYTNSYKKLVCMNSHKNKEHTYSNSHMPIHTMMDWNMWNDIRHFVYVKSHKQYKCTNSHMSIHTMTIEICEMLYVNSLMSNHTNNKFIWIHWNESLCMNSSKNKEHTNLYIWQADRDYNTEISPRSFVISFVILLYAISYNICI